MHEDLGRSLRAWRERLDPSGAGVPRQTARRTPGLRREEVAAQAGISVNYLIRLEQGRAQAPSLSVVSALGRALRLDPPELGRLHHLAGFADPNASVATRRITPTVQRILDRLNDVPVIVVDAAWTIIAANPMALAFFSAEVVGDNAARRQFIGPSWVERDVADEEAYERDLVGDLLRQLALHPDDDAVRTLVDDLHRESERFAALWAERPAGFSSTTRKTFYHPTVGKVTVDCDVLDVVGSDLRIVIWTAAPGSGDATALEILGSASMEKQS